MIYTIQHRSQLERFNGFGYKAKTIGFDALHHVIGAIGADDHPFKTAAQSKLALLEHF